MASSEPRWHSEAVDDAYEARNWYADRSPLAARGFLLALEAAIEAVVAYPRRYPQIRFGCRKYVFPNRYPFNLIYRILPDDVVEIVAVASQWRMPEYWSGR